ncbi:TonB-dependent receptor [Pseudoalteromonas sp. MMG024]|uniref:TonB-dependent receptor domain-containing protein n=1 Tax=Pseudoalteromonas sp. MMG024 TaxID=2909980 RepID=UPI0031BA0327|nr:TonB-dependent receptor [Pseudoalteromonas sp. MMG024]
MGINTNKCSVAAAIAFAISGNAWADAEVERQAVAQSNNVSQQAAKKEAPEKITVTGSRIKRDSFSVATPIATMDRNAIDDTGLGSLSEILVNELPQVSEGSSNSNSQSSVQNTGLSTIDLRELGTNRTLTLIDGRRVVSNSYSGNYVSLSTIPTSMVDKVEIITGGASAAYGSDAIAGVVNIITQQDKEGFSIKARGGESTEGGAKEFTIDSDFGTTYGNERGYAFLSLTYDEQKGLSYWDRDRAQQMDSWRYDDDEMCNQMLTESGYQCMRDISRADWRSLSDSIPGGVFDEKSSTRPDAGFWYDGQTLRDDWHEERYGIDYNQYTMLKVPDKALAIAGKTEFEVNDDVEVYFQAQYSRNTSENLKSPESEDECDSIITHDTTTGIFGSDCIGRIPYDNPYMPEEIREQASSRGVKWDRNFIEVGQILNKNTRDTLRTWAGARGTIWNDWDWDLSVSYGKFKQEQERSNELFVANVRNALNAEVLADGTIQCKDADARAEGCVPLNLFGEGSITPEAANYIRANTEITSNIEQTTVMGYVAGDLFDMPAGAVSSAFGFEYRKDEQSVETNVPEGGVTFNYVPDFKGDVSVYEAFGEAAIPLLKDVTGAQSLDLEVSARFADYSWSSTGLIQSYKTGLIYVPVDGYMVRANWARAQRAPTITDLMSPPRGDYDSFNDICDGVTATSTDAGHDNCRQDPGIAATIAADGEFEDDNNGYSPNVGNSNLKEETADTFTLGVSIAPSFIEDFRLAVDYYDIQIDDAITSLSNEDIIGFCYDSALPFGDNNEFCNDITRNTEGQIEEVQQRLINTDGIRTKGYDVAAEYLYDLDEYGSLRFKADWTHVIEYSVTSTGPDGQFSDTYEGVLVNDLFEDKASASVTWYKNDVRVRWSTRYKGAIRRSQSTYESWLEDMAANDERCAQGSDACVAAPEALWGSELPSVTTHNISASYTMDIGKSSELRVFGGINNLFDENGPYILGGRGNYDSAYGGGRGRFVYLGAQYSF